jgi:gamma-glutamyl:cysteine ligase YbdK (ATP-grasp superfamily)
VAQLSPETKALLNAQKERLLELIDRAKFLEFTIFDNFGENIETIATLEQLTEIVEQARTRFAQFSTLELRIAEAQPTISSALLKLTNEAITHTQNRIPALFRSLEEIELDWRLN